MCLLICTASSTILASIVVCADVLAKHNVNALGLERKQSQAALESFEQRYPNYRNDPSQLTEQARLQARAADVLQLAAASLGL